jgi:hypothetical protein
MPAVLNGTERKIVNLQGPSINKQRLGLLTIFPSYDCIVACEVWALLRRFTNTLSELSARLVGQWLNRYFVASPPSRRRNSKVLKQGRWVRKRQYNHIEDSTHHNAPVFISPLSSVPATIANLCPLPTSPYKHRIEPALNRDIDRDVPLPCVIELPERGIRVQAETRRRLHVAGKR